MVKCKIYFTRAVITVRHGSEVIKRKNKPNFTRYQKINDTHAFGTPNRFNHEKMILYLINNPNPPKLPWTGREFP